ncbi:MAG: 23S rRNA pseudouridine(1911/1915/1917) synthase RluD [Gammaproteobacteria bacterium]
MPEEQAGKRLDQALAELFPDYSRSRIKAWIDAGQVLLDGKPPRPRTRVRGGEEVALKAVIESVEVPVEPQQLKLDIVFEDADLIVVNKAAGMVTHPGAGNPRDTLQNGLLGHDPTLSALPRSGLIHRLDKDTSGLLVVARTVPAVTRLTRAMQSRAIERQYIAVCRGVMTAGGTIEQPVGRHPVDRTRMAVHERGRPAVTLYRVVQRYRAHTRCLVRLETGRTHQIRVHFAHLGFPLVGDKTYGGRLAVPRGATERLAESLRAFRRQALHASRLTLDHPSTGERMEWQVPLPTDLAELVNVLKGDLNQATERHR